MACLKTDSENTICKHIFSTVSVLSKFILNNFQGSCSAKYLFPSLARSISW